MRAANGRAARGRWTRTWNSATPRSRRQGVEVTDPEGKRPLTLGEAAAAQSFQLTEAGYYQLRLANGRQDEVGVNPDPKESNLDVIPDDVLALWQGKGGRFVATASAAGPADAAQDPANAVVVRHAVGAGVARWPNRCWPAAT